VWADIASRHGFSNAEGLQVGEKWHWVGSGVISPVGDIYAPIEIEENDIMNSDQQRVLQEVHNAVNGPGGLAEVVANLTRDVGDAKASASAAANSAEQARQRIGADLDGRLTDLPLSKLLDGKNSAGSIIKSTWGRTEGLGGRSSRADTLLTRIAAKLGLSTTTDADTK
jgi:hypothetical protein